MWINVKDKLPKPGEWVVVCVAVNDTPQCLAFGTYNEEIGEWHTVDWDDGEQEVYVPDYWMPIPYNFRPIMCVADQLLQLTWQDMKLILICEEFTSEESRENPGMFNSVQEYYERVLERFKAAKEADFPHK